MAFNPVSLRPKPNHNEKQKKNSWKIFKQKLNETTIKSSFNEKLNKTRNSKKKQKTVAKIITIGSFSNENKVKQTMQYKHYWKLINDKLR